MADPDDNVLTLPHPNAPRGGGGPGGFAQARPLGSSPFKAKPAPQSPAGKSASSGSGGAAPVPPPPAPPPLPRDYNTDIKDAAEKLVGNPVVGDGECYALADRLLTGVGAQSAPAFGKITDDANYQWGDTVPLSRVVPGNVLQFRNHSYTVTTVTKVKRTWGPDGGNWKEDIQTQEEKHNRGHHTAVVTGVKADGVLTVVEQHLTNFKTQTLYTDVRRNDLYTRDISGKPVTTTTYENDPVNGKVKVETTVTTTTKVSGKIWAYSATDQPPKKKPKGKK